jgi:hypothetical protein
MLVAERFIRSCSKKSMENILCIQMEVHDDMMKHVMF